MLKNDLTIQINVILWLINKIANKPEVLLTVDMACSSSVAGCSGALFFWLHVRLPVAFIAPSQIQLDLRSSCSMSSSRKRRFGLAFTGASLDSFPASSVDWAIILSTLLSFVSVTGVSGSGRSSLSVARR
jgi:hypothetical protein